LVELVPWGVAAGVLHKAWQFPEKRKTWFEGTGQQKQNKMKDLEIELMQLELEGQKQEAELKQEVNERLRALFPESELTDDEITQRIDDHLLPHLRALGRTGVAEIKAADTETDAAEDDQG